MKLRFHEKFMKTFLHPKEIWKSKVEALVCKIKNVSENISTPCAIAVHQFKDSYRNGRNTHTDFSKILNQ
jgi:hypothetical protein